MRKFFLFSVLVVMMVVVAGCSSSSSPSSGGGNGSGPATGSTFTYRVIQYDVDNFTPLTIDTVVATATGTASSFNGQSNVVQFSNASSFDGSNLIYYSNGNVGAYIGETQPYGGNSQWVTLPFSGGAGSRVVFFTGDSVMDVASSRSGPNSASSISLGSKSVSIYEAEIVDSTHKLLFAGDTAIYFQTSDYWFSPSLGAMTNVAIGWYTNAQTGALVGKRVATLIEATIK